MAGKEQDAGRDIQKLAANAPGNEPMKGAWGDVLGDAEHAQIE
jgi:hypothetical protein